jgi:HEPN domain-containing protein
MALEYISRAHKTLKEAKSAYDGGDYPLTVRRAQETVELSLKAALRFLGIEYPREHDVRDVFLEAVKSRSIPEWFKAEAEFMGNISSNLAMKRGLAFYGDEQSLKPPSSLFTRADASEALQSAERVYENCRRLIETPSTYEKSGSGGS